MYNAAPSRDPFNRGRFPKGFSWQDIRKVTQKKPLGSLLLENVVLFVGHHPILVGIFVALSLAFYLNERIRGGKELSPQEAVSLINRENALVVDLRDGKEFLAGHIVSAMHIPHGAFESRINELASFKARPIILVCRMGQHAGLVGAKLRTAGFAQVMRLNGGMMEWQNSNLPVIKG